MILAGYRHGYIDHIYKFFFNRGYLLASAGNILSHYIMGENEKNYNKNREDTMTNIIATHICNINETFIAIFMGIPLGYIA